MAVNLDIQNLIDLIDELRYAGYDIGTQQYIAAQNLLIALAARGELPQDLRSLRTWLAPVICSSPREQENFYRYFDRWIASHPELTMPAAAEGRPLPAGERIDHPERDWRDFLRQPAFALAVTVLLISVGVALLFWMRPRTQQLSGTVIDNDTNQRVSGAAISFNGQTKTTDNNGAFSVTYKSQELPKDLTVANVGYETTTVQVTSQTKSPIEIRLQQPQPPPSPLPAGEGTPSPTATPIPLLDAPAVSSNTISKRRAWIGYAAIALPFFLFAGWWLWQSRFNRGLLRKLQRAGEPQLEQLIVKGAGAQLFPGQSIRRTIQELRRHRQRGANDLDAQRTVNLTIENGGLFSPVYGLRQTLPEYLILIERASLGDHQAKLQDEIVRRLIQDNVFVDAYHFQGDPRFCRKGTLACVSLQEMAARHPDHHLIIFSDGANFINPFSGEPERWLENFFPWAKRVLITPEPPVSWGERERMLADAGFIVLPSGSEGLIALSEVAAGGVPKIDAEHHTRPFPSMLRKNPKRWLENREPQPAKANRLCDQLKFFLGAGGYHWLSACAVYPQLFWEMTLFLGRNLFRDRLELEECLLSLVRLPWFRYGSLPDWLRLRLISSLSPDDEKSVRMALENLFLTMMQHPADCMRLEVATEPAAGLFTKLKQRFASWKFRLTFRQYLKHQPPDSPLRDYVFLSFMSKRKPRKLSVSLPDSIRRLVFPQGQSALGMRPASALLLAVIFSLSVFFVNRRVAASNTKSELFYTDMSVAQQDQFILQQLEMIRQRLGATPEDLKALSTSVKPYVDAYAARVGKESTTPPGEDLAFVFGRSLQFAPVINKAFRDRSLSPLIGLYVAMVESEYRPNAVNSQAGFFNLPIRARALDWRGEVLEAADYAKGFERGFGRESRMINHFGMYRVDNGDAAYTGYVYEILAATMIGESPHSFRLDMNPLSSYTTIPAEDVTDIIDLVGRLGETDPRAVIARLVELYAGNKTAVVQQLIDAIKPDSSYSYHYNLYIATTLASIKPNWEGTADQIGKVMALQKSRDYSDKTFQLWVDKAINNFQRKKIIDCDCADVEAGILTREYQKQCASVEEQLWKQIRDTSHLTGRCDPIASGPKAKPSGTVSPTPTPTPTPTTERAPNVNLVASPTTVEPGLPVRFMAQTDLPTGEIARFEFTFGDGTPDSVIGVARVAVATHRFSTPGDYAARVIMVTQTGREVLSSPALIKVTASMGVIPDLVGKTESEVRRMFNPKTEFKLGSVTYHPTDNVGVEGTVLGQNPAAGTRAPNGTTISIIVAREPGTDEVFVQVPDVVGRSLYAAQETLLTQGLRAKPVSTSGSAQAQAAPPKAEVIKQTPAKGTKVKKGTVVELSLKGW